MLIAYDAVLACTGSWEEFVLRGVLHGGDCDSTGAIGGAFFGAIYGTKGVNRNHYADLTRVKKKKKLPTTTKFFILVSNTSIGSTGSQAPSPTVC